MSTQTDSGLRLPPLPVIDVLDKWVHGQTRFHLPDTDGYEAMLRELAVLIEADRRKSVEEAETRARIDEHKTLWEMLPMDVEHVGTVRDISDLRVVKLEAQLSSPNTNDREESKS